MQKMTNECGVCLGLNIIEKKQLIYCEGADCQVTVHPGCYGIKKLPIGPWFCDKCESNAGEKWVMCCLCPNQNAGNIFKKIDDLHWAHAVCAYSLGSGVKWKTEITVETCYICEDAESKDEFDAAIGSCLNCFVHGCENYFHATCAQSKGLLRVDFDSQIENERIKLNAIKFKGSCKEHLSRTEDSSSSMKEVRISGSENYASDSSKEFTKLKRKNSGSPWIVQRISVTSTRDNCERSDKIKQMQEENRCASELSNDNLDMDKKDIFCLSFDDAETESTDSFTNQKLPTLAMMDVHSEIPSSKKKLKLNPFEEEKSSESIEESQSHEKKCVKRYTKEQLECLVLDQMVMLITANGSIAKLKSTVESYEKELAHLKKKTFELNGQVQSYNNVLRKFVQQKIGNNTYQPPEKILRSVGVQVNVLKLEVADPRTASSLRAPRNALVSFRPQESRVSEKQTKVPETVSPSPSVARKMLPSTKPTTSQSGMTREPTEFVVIDDLNLPSQIEHSIPPLPPVINNPDNSLKALPPKPLLQIIKNSTSLHFSWTFPNLPESASLSYFKIWMHYKLLDGSTSYGKWTVMDREIKARPSPMTCTIGSMAAQKYSSEYHFAIQATDILNRRGPFSDPVFIVYP